MNFKRYHVSKQLFDKDTATIYTLYAGNGDIIRTSSNARSIAISCTGGEIYTVSKKAGQRFMVCFTTEPIASQVPYTNLVTDNTATSITAEAPEGAKYLFVYFYNSTADTDTIETLLNSIMINTGSQPLPYEPYSSEVWHGIPHYTHKTATDTLTLPATLYPNDTTVTVGIKGNATQSGTPTHDNPIIPQGTGERTGNLYPLDASKLHVGRIENDGTIDYEIGTLTVGTDSVTYEANTMWRGFYTDFIQVNENEKLTFSPNDSSFIAWSCSCYDEDDNFLGKASGQSVASIRTFTLLTGTKKVRMSVTSSNTSYTITNPMLNLGSTPLPYEPYGYFIEIEVS